jgi:hypothetical protein
MSVLPICFENIVGLSRTDCECVEDRPVDAGVSESGLYIDDLPGLDLLMLNASSKCGQGTLWDMLDRARSEAIEQTKNELAKCINANTDQDRQLGESIIGSDKKATSTSQTLRYPLHGMTLQTAKVKGGYFAVTAIGVGLKGDSLPATIDLNVWTRPVDEPASLQTITLPVTNNRIVWTTLPTPLELSTEALGASNPRYWFTYAPPTGAKALNTMINCGCGGFAPYWNEASPQYASRQQKGGTLWAEWCMAAGTRGSDVTTREEWTVENNTSGLLLKVQFFCDEMSTFCPDAPNYATDAIMGTIAHAVRFMAGSNLITNLLRSTQINVYTMTAGEQLAKIREVYNTGFSDAIMGYVCPELSKKENVNRYGDCRKCKDHFHFRKGMLRS